jgi:hypothetical protein
MKADDIQCKITIEHSLHLRSSGDCWKAKVRETFYGIKENDGYKKGLQIETVVRFFTDDREDKNIPLDCIKGIIDYLNQKEG